MGTMEKVRPEDLIRLEEIQLEMLDLLKEARRIVQMSGNSLVWERARGYWGAHIEGALTRDTEWLGGSMVTMEDTIRELRGEED